MMKLHSSMARWNSLTLVLALVVAASASLPGCGGDAEKTTPQTEYPAEHKAADQAQIDFMKTQGKAKKR
ncbi:hypothetical protein [Singulisphaera acidiphila]|uniref:Secreted protein n=1 Tax=Singulisphaera acidiphila (strain ATCC BAA-1392 / DSM 18658 / VKM B-2454 / MOB10) TaxID=886293 RepID=L0DJZ9_SINAD|nr:hypothetical protein [Singulisphaera acidiphila]AGA29163.1 hypothetical protein Sinac_5009 [Singulisphaera acidiphila DSM 18658]